MPLRRRLLGMGRRYWLGGRRCILVGLAPTGNRGGADSLPLQFHLTQTKSHQSCGTERSRAGVLVGGLKRRNGWRSPRGHSIQVGLRDPLPNSSRSPRIPRSWTWRRRLHSGGRSSRQTGDVGRLKGAPGSASGVGGLVNPRSSPLGRRLAKPRQRWSAGTCSDDVPPACETE